MWIKQHLKHCTAELPLKAGLTHASQMHEYLQSMYEPWPSWKFSAAIALEIPDGIIFDFYMGLSHI